MTLHDVDAHSVTENKRGLILHPDQSVGSLREIADDDPRAIAGIDPVPATAHAIQESAEAGVCTTLVIRGPESDAQGRFVSTAGG